MINQIGKIGGGCYMKETFDDALKFVLDHEGYVSNNPKDPGGLTVFGLSKRAFGSDVDKMAKMSKDDAKVFASAIYRTHYWDALGLNEYHFPLDIVLFDTAVNQCINKARTLLTLASGDVFKFIVLRIKHYNHLGVLPKYKVFLKGWLNRVRDLCTLISLDYEKLLNESTKQKSKHN